MKKVKSVSRSILVIFFLFFHCGKTDNITDGQEAKSWVKIAELGQSELVKQIYFLSQQTGFLIGSQGKLLRTSDGGITWKSIDTGTDLSLYSITFLDERNGLVAGQNNFLLRTSDAGLSWKAVNIEYDSSSHFTAISFADGRHGWLLDNKGTLFFSQDSGFTWIQKIGLPMSCGMYMQFKSTTTGFAGCFTGFLYKTTDCSVWEMITLSVPNQKYGIHIKDINFVNTLVGYYIFEWQSGGYKETATPIMKTIDGGHHWTCQDSIPTPALYCMHFINDSTGWIAGDGFYYIKNSGEKWELAGKPEQSDVIIDIFFTGKNHGWALGRKGIIYNYHL